MNENQSNYILILKTLQSDPEENINVIIKGTHGQTEKILLRKSQVERNNYPNLLYIYYFSHIIKLLEMIKLIFF